ncbi:winged helix DNA-binding domain-containing protein [Nocardiopsis sp. RSe5-2]|uniref:Winged helix DNA-binding domain-containing protein n=1 Tax=Nocardiopsis endophytica TaxID=3018445 RepID=A0ABT4UE38_9ACTN|nr:crosslink repair DNA glycosylase YcaQ family protein [Nocardiopsis endophytica]MDA2815253.1 winged helix DNA-binding domain-containing protein [Nocardiopsis endophytica]
MGAATGVPRLGRAAVLGHRVRAHDLDRPGGGARVLAVGLQDHPPGRTAEPALRLRGGPPPGRRTVLLHSLRGALHLHDAEDAPLLAAALRVDDARQLQRQTAGPTLFRVQEEGPGLQRALDRAAVAMREAADSSPAHTKGELSTAATSAVEPLIPAAAPWCAGCGVRHIDDLLFRMATLLAGLGASLVDGATVYRRLPEAGEPPPADVARVELVQRFLRVFGPARPVDLAAWTGRTPATARSWWSTAASALRPVEVEGKRRWAPDTPGEAPEPGEAPPGSVRLLGPYDPFTALADRAFLVPDPVLRRRVWRAAGTPGTVLARGEIAGVWRRRTRGGRLDIEVAPFGAEPGWGVADLEDDARLLADCAGASEAAVRVDAEIQP